MSKTTIQNVGKRKEPSKEALDRFIEVYKRMVDENNAKSPQKSK